MSVLTKENFTELQPEQLCLFNVPGTQTGVEKVYFQQVRPISQISNNSNVEFNVNSGNSLDYIDLKSSRLYVKLKVIHADGTPLVENEKVGPVNLLLQSLWSQVEVALQGKVVASSNSYYGYNAYIQTLLKSSADEKQSRLTSQLYELDTPGFMDENDPIEGLNTALYNRSLYVKDSKFLSMEGPLYHPMFQLKRYVLNQTDVQVKLYRQRPNFCLTAPDGDYEIVLEDIILKVAKVRVNPAVIYSHGQVLQSTNAKYPFIRTDIKMFSLPAGQISCSFDNMFQGNRPNKVVVGFVSSKAAAGDISKNPFNFKHYHVTSINLSVDGESVGGSAIKTHFDNNSLCVTPFMNMYDTFRKADDGNGISIDSFANGYALYCFNLEPNFESEEYVTLLRRGNVALECQFNHPLPETVVALVYAENMDFFEISKSRDVILE